MRLWTRAREIPASAPARRRSTRSPASSGPARTVRLTASSGGMTTDLAQKTRTLKAVVIGLGVLIVLALAALGVGIVYRIDRVAGPASGEGFASAGVVLPAGSRAIAMTGEGDVLSILVEDAKGRQQVLTVDRRSGAVLGTLTLAPAP